MPLHRDHRQVVVLKTFDTAIVGRCGDTQPFAQLINALVMQRVDRLRRPVKVGEH